MTDVQAPCGSADNFEMFRTLVRTLQDEMWERFNRRVSLADLLFDRWERARYYGFGEGTSCYDNVLILGDVKVGRHCWIGPNVILDGSGGLEIGDHCSISAGAQIYSHNTVFRSTTLGDALVDRCPTRIGNGVYIGPGAVVQMGCTIGDRSVIGALSLVNKNVPPHARCYGVPGRIQPGA